MSVTFFHLTGSTGLSEKIAECGSYGWIGVQIFFIISGFVLPFSMNKVGYKITDIWIFFLKRITRIYPVYVVAIVISMVLAILTGRELLSGLYLVSHLFFLNDLFSIPSLSPVFWTLIVELQFYFLLGIFYPIVANYNYKSLIFNLLISFVSLWCIQSSVIYWFPFFALGILVFNRLFTHMTAKMFWIGMVPILGIITVNHSIIHAIIGLSTVLFVLFVKVKNENYLSKILVGLGAVSYSLYITHWELGRAAITVSRKFPFIGDSEVFRVLLGLLCSVFSAYLLYFCIEKPGLKFSSKIKYRNPVKRDRFGEQIDTKTKEEVS